MPDKLMTTRLCESKSACGPEREIKVFAEQDDINLEYCDREDADKDWCVYAVQSFFCMKKKSTFRSNNDFVPPGSTQCFAF